MTQADERVLLELDSRRRVNLQGLARHDLYLGTVEEDGTIILTPAVVMTSVDLLQLMARVSDVDTLADPRDRKTRVPQNGAPAAT